MIKDSFSASVTMVDLTAPILVITAIVLIVAAIKTMTATTIRLVSTGYPPPTVEMPATCKFHMVKSHTWLTGKSKTHAISLEI